MPAWQSTAPAVIDALVALWTGPLASADCVTVDGPAVTGSARKAALMVGWNDADPEAASAEGTDGPDGFGATVRELYAVTCTLKLRAGGSQAVAWSAQRAALFDLHRTARSALAADPTLGGLVYSAIPGAWSLFQPNKQLGRDAALVFEVDIDALAK